MYPSSKRLATAIVEDSPAQRAVISKLVTNHPSLRLAHAFDNGISALNGMQKDEIDLLFLDVEMPLVNGFDLLEALSNPPMVILISNKSDYAFKAFDYDVLDYLKKPVDRIRFNLAVSRALKVFGSFQAKSEYDDFIMVNSDLQKIKVYLRDIKWVEALGDYIKIVTNEKRVLVSSTLKAFLTQLPQGQFVRIHKSYIVNATKVDNWTSRHVEIEGTPHSHEQG